MSLVLNVHLTVAPMIRHWVRHYDIFTIQFINMRLNFIWHITCIQRIKIVHIQHVASSSALRNNNTTQTITKRFHLFLCEQWCHFFADFPISRSTCWSLKFQNSCDNNWKRNIIYGHPICFTISFRCHFLCDLYKKYNRLIIVYLISHYFS